MKRTRVVQEVRMMRFEELYERQQQRRLNQEEAAKILGVDVRTFRRWSRHYEEDGVQGLIDQRLVADFDAARAGGSGAQSGSAVS